MKGTMHRTAVCVGFVFLMALTASAATWYVAPDSLESGPGTAWSNAFHTIQGGVDVASGGDTVWVTNGIYNTGGTVTPGYGLTNRVCVTKDISIKSVNGPDHTLIVGVKDDSNGSSNAVRGVYLGAGSLSGFTVTNAETWSSVSDEVDDVYDQSGGGLLMEAGTEVSNCVITDCRCGMRNGGGVYCHNGGVLNHCTIANSAASSVYDAAGGGCCGGTLNHCILSGNRASNGAGVAGAVLNHCTISGNEGKVGGGCDNCTLNDCVVSENTCMESDGAGGGSHESTLNRCVLFDNRASQKGGGSCDSTLNDCLLYRNDSPYGGVYEGTLKNCTVADNSGPGGISAAFDNCIVYGNGAAPFNCTLNFCCTNDPGFVNPAADEYRLRSSSPCIDAGDNSLAPSGSDLAGGLRIINGTVDIGAYEKSVQDMGESPRHYVSPDGGNVWPYTNWVTAATCIQDAVDAAAAGDTVWVTNGIYNTGGAIALSFRLANRVAITKDITVESISGSGSTFIVGASDSGTNGPATMRGVFMNAGTLSGFTITNGHTLVTSPSSHDMRGGGILCYYGSPVVSNCVICGNAADTGGGGILLGGGTPLVERCEIRGNECLAAGADGGGVIFFNGSGRMRNCLLSDNVAADTGGGMLFGSAASNCVAEGCTVTANSSGVRLWNGTVRNCIVYGNDGDDNWSIGGNSPLVEYTCTSPTNGLPGGTGCIDADPQFENAAGEDYRLHVTSPCIDAGTNVQISGETDLDGFPRVAGNSVDMGAYEFHPLPAIQITSKLDVVDTPTVDLEGDCENLVGSIVWSNQSTSASGMVPVTGNTFYIPGIPVMCGLNEFVVYGSNIAEVVASDWLDVTRSVARDDGDSPVHYVSPDGRDVWPYTNWTGAATSIQAAIAAAAPGDTVIVTNGVYNSGITEMPGVACYNRICITNDILVKSVNGPGATKIVGAPDPETGDAGSDAVRGAFITTGVLSGFTVTNGYTMATGDLYLDRCGGGINMYGGNGSVSSCILVGNHAFNYGGGTHCGTVRDCTVKGNTAEYGGGCDTGTLIAGCILSGNSATECGGGSCDSALSGCTLSGNQAGWDGGGSCDSTLTNCVLTGNHAEGKGGGSDGGTLENCLLTGNSADGDGGGSAEGELRNCTLCNNSATNGGGCAHGTVDNSIIYGNSASGSGPNWYNSTTPPEIYTSCTTPLPAGDGGNIADDPRFVNETGGNYHLLPGSSCIDGGDNDYAAGDPDLDGSTRIVDGDFDSTATVDMGAYEYDPAATDSDGDGFSDYDEYVADTGILDSNAWFHITSVSNNTVYFNSSSNRLYSLLWSTNLVEGVWTTNAWRMGVGGADFLQSTNHLPLEFYKLKVQLP